MDPDTEVVLDFPPMFRLYKSGRVERLMGTARVPAACDIATGVTSKDVTIDPATGLAARLYLPTKPLPTEKLPVVIYFHGGGFCNESAFSATYHPFLNSLACRANVVVVSVEYRLAPEHPLPAAYDDSWAALQWSLSHGSGSGSVPEPEPWLAEHGDFSRVFLAGDSAGANIAHQMALRAGAEGVALEGMALVHPFFWGAHPLEAETREPAERGWIEGLWKVVNQPGVGLDHLWIDPVAAGVGSLSGVGCRRVIICLAKEDWLVLRGRVYCEGLRESGWGGELEVLESEGKAHVFHLGEPEGEKALEMMERLVAFFNRK